MSYRTKHRCSDRKGTVLIAVLVCMSVVMALLLGTLKMTISMRRQAQKERLVEQARCMVDAGIRYSKASLAKDPEYQGDSIELTLSDKGRIHSIKIERIESESEVRVSAEIGKKEAAIPETKRSRTIPFDR